MNLANVVWAVQTKTRIKKSEGVYPFFRDCKIGEIVIVIKKQMGQTLFSIQNSVVPRTVARVKEMPYPYPSFSG